MPLLRKKLAEGSDVLVCNNWFRLKETGLHLKPDWLFLLDMLWCMELLYTEAEKLRQHGTRITISYQIDQKPFAPDTVYSQMYGEWKDYPDTKNRPRNAKYCWPMRTFYPSGNRMMETALMLGYNRIDVFGWTFSPRERYGEKPEGEKPEGGKIIKTRAYKAEPIVLSETFINSVNRGEKYMRNFFNELDASEKAKFFIHEYNDHPLYTCVPECFHGS